MLVSNRNMAFASPHDFPNKDATTGVDKGAYTTFYHQEVKTAPELCRVPNETKEKFTNKDDIKKRSSWYTSTVPVITNYLSLATLGLLIWGTLWCLWGSNWAWHGQWFRLAVVAVIAWASGQALQALTTLPPMLAALLTGILARNLGFLDMNEYTEIDMFLRKIYPIVILGKGALAWDLGFMKANWVRVAVLGALPWLTEVTVLAFCAHYLLGFPLIWGFLLGPIYASLSCGVVMPPVAKISAKLGAERNWGKLVCTAGGVDTALSVGVFGIIFTFMFYETTDTYRYAKAGLTLFAGVGLGAAMGCAAGVLPHRRDFYVTELRIVLVMVGGLFANLVTTMLGWGGTGGVAVLVCNATAAWFWARDGWKLNNNPASTAYRVFWCSCEPVLFAYTGTFFEINSSMSQILLPGFGILAVCLLVRWTFVCLACWGFTLKERLFMCCVWTPKSIVEAVLCPMAINTLILMDKREGPEWEYAHALMRLLVQAILVTTPLGFLLTSHLGPLLLKQPEKDCEKNVETLHKRKSNGSQHEDRT